MKILIKPIFLKLLIAVGIALLILLVIFIALEKAKSSRMAKETAEREHNIETQYSQIVSQKTDVYALTKSGLRQLNINLPALALISLKRAADINQNYRDAHLALGLAQLKTGDFSGALSSFQTAERLDPIYAKTYELLKIVYEKLEDTDSATKANTKYEFLTKTN